MYSVYKHTFPNGKVYIGITSRDVKVRWGNGNNYKNCIAMDRAIKKYGWGNVKHDVLRTVDTKEEAERLEKLFIYKFGSNDERFGYNILAGGDARGDLPEKSKQRIGEKNKKIWLENPEKKQQAAMRMKKRMEDPRYRQKVIDALKNSNAGERKKKRVRQMDLDGNLIKIWNGLADIERAGIATRQAISLCCLGKMKTAKGFQWCFEKVK